MGHHHGGHCQHNHLDFSGIKNDRLKKLVTYTSVAVAVTLIGAKVVAWVLTGSVSILSSLADSVLDMLASVVNLFAVHHAMRPATEEYRFGHGKIEAIAALGQASVIVISVLFVFYEAVNHLMNPVAISAPSVGIIVMLISIFLTLLLVTFQSYVIKRTRSIAISADSMHYKADLYLNIGVLISVGLTYWVTVSWIDPLVGFAIGGYILYTAWHIAKDAFNILMDRELPTEMRDQIAHIIKSHPAVHGIHELKTRSSGTQDFIQVHVELDGDMSLNESHAIAAEIDESIRKEFTRAHVTIHQDPRGLTENHVSL